MRSQASFKGTKQKALIPFFSSLSSPLYIHYTIHSSYFPLSLSYSLTFSLFHFHGFHRRIAHFIFSFSPPSSQTFFTFSITLYLYPSLPLQSQNPISQTLLLFRRRRISPPPLLRRRIRRFLLPPPPPLLPDCPSSQRKIREKETSR